MMALRQAIRLRLGSATPRMWRMVSAQLARYVAGEALLNVVTEGY